LDLVSKSQAATSSLVTPQSFRTFTTIAAIDSPFTSLSFGAARNLSPSIPEEAI